MAFERDFAFGNKRLSDAASCLTDLLAFDKCICLRGQNSPDNNQNRRARAEPVERPPAMRRSVD